MNFASGYLKQIPEGGLQKYAVLIDGARRVGKSWIAEEFGKREYEKYVLIDFSKASPALKRIFVENLHDLDTFFLLLENEI